MISSSDLELVWDSRCQVAESCVFDAGGNRILFADQTAGLIHALGITDGSRHSWTLPGAIGSFGLCNSGRLVVALHRRVVLLDLRSGATEPLTSELDEPVRNKFNDGKVGPDGCFWVGTSDGRPVAEREPIGALYRVSPDGTMERKSFGYLVCNGLAWSPDGRTMFHSDSSARYVDAWDFEASSGAISRRRKIAIFAEDEGKPDGAACDTEGCYWSAAVQAGRLIRFSPDGDILTQIDLPIPSPTMPCFAGEWLYLTSMRRNNDEETLNRLPNLGGLFRMRAPALGADIGLFADD